MRWFRREPKKVKIEEVLARIEVERTKHERYLKAQHDHAFEHIMLRLARGQFQVVGDILRIHTQKVKQTDKRALEERLADTRFRLLAFEANDWTDSYYVDLCIQEESNS